MHPVWSGGGNFICYDIVWSVDLKAVRIRIMALEGVNSSIRKLKKMGASVPDTALTALRSGGLIIVNYAKDTVVRESGTLAKSIDIRTTTKTYIQVTVTVGTSKVPYAARIEFGFAKADKLGRIYNQKPQPYIRPAFDNNKSAVEDEVVEVLQLLARGA